MRLQEQAPSPGEPMRSPAGVCHICQQSALIRAFAAPGFDSPAESFNVMLCDRCRVMSTSPMLDPEQLSEYYTPNYYGGGSQERASQQKFVGWVERLVHIHHRWRAARLVTHMDAIPGRAARDIKVLDVGCGRGGFLRELSKRGYACTGIDIAPFDENEGSQRPYEFKQGPLASHKFPAAAFDAVSIWHVLEHLHDPVATLQELARVLKPGGILSLAVPNVESWQAKVFKGQWFHLDLPRHLFHFGPASLHPLLRQAGFSVMRQHTLSWEQNTYGCLQSAQNALLPKAYQNQLYTLLKNHGSAQGRTLRARLSLAGLAGMAAAMMPLAIAEGVSSAFVGRGASLILYARRAA